MSQTPHDWPTVALPAVGGDGAAIPPLAVLAPAPTLPPTFEQVCATWAALIACGTEETLRWWWAR